LKLAVWDHLEGRNSGLALETMCKMQKIHVKSENVSLL